MKTLFNFQVFIIAVIIYFIVVPVAPSHAALINSNLLALTTEPIESKENGIYRWHNRANNRKTAKAYSVQNIVSYNYKRQTGNKTPYSSSGYKITNSKKVFGTSKNYKQRFSSDSPEERVWISEGRGTIRLKQNYKQQF